MFGFDGGRVADMPDGCAVHASIVGACVDAMPTSLGRVDGANDAAGHAARLEPSTLRGNGHSAPRVSAYSRPTWASRLRVACCAGLRTVGQPIRCCSAISARPAIQSGLSFRQGM